MDYKQNPIWNKLQSFPFDAPNLITTFPDRLANEGNWTKEFTFEVIEEYKRCLFLISTEPQSILVPPPAVILAWETHEYYYPLAWKEIWTQILQLTPKLIKTDGYDEVEDYYWVDEYLDQTILKYQQIFHTVPPEDIWPLPEPPDPYNTLMPGNNRKRTGNFNWLSIPLVLIVPLLGHFNSNPLIVSILVASGITIVILIAKSPESKVIRSTGYYKPSLNKK